MPADKAVNCTYSGISHAEREALYFRPVHRFETMYYCQECRDALPPCPSNLKDPPQRLSDRLIQEKLL